MKPGRCKTTHGRSASRNDRKSPEKAPEINEDIFNYDRNIHKMTHEKPQQIIQKHLKIPQVDIRRSIFNYSLSKMFLSKVEKKSKIFSSKVEKKSKIFLSKRREDLSVKFSASRRGLARNSHLNSPQQISNISLPKSADPNTKTYFPRTKCRNFSSSFDNSSQYNISNFPSRNSPSRRENSQSFYSPCNLLKTLLIFSLTISVSPLTMGQQFQTPEAMGQRSPASNPLQYRFPRSLPIEQQFQSSNPIVQRFSRSLPIEEQSPASNPLQHRFPRSLPIEEQFPGSSPLVQRFANQPFPQTAVVGSTVVLPCRVVNMAGELQWTRDDFGLGNERELTAFKRYQMIGSHEEGEHSIIIKPL